MHIVNVIFCLYLSFANLTYGTVKARIKSNKIIIRTVTDLDSPLSKVMELAGGGYREGW